MAFRRLGLPLRGEEEERPPKIRKVAEKEATSGEAEANGNRSERGKADRKANIVAASAVGVKAKKCLEETQETINRKIQVLATHFQTGGAQADAEESENEDQDADANDSNAGLVANSHRRAALTPAKT
eukprot:g10147.t1